MEEHYYLAPITNEHLFINNMNMGELCKEKYPLLAEISNAEDEYCYTNANESIFVRIKHLSQKCHKLFKIPKYFIVIQKGNKLSELMSGLEIATDSFAELKKHETIETEPILEFFIKSDYKNTLPKLFKDYGLLNDKEIIKRLA